MQTLIASPSSLSDRYRTENCHHDLLQPRPVQIAIACLCRSVHSMALSKTEAAPLQSDVPLGGRSGNCRQRSGHGHKRPCLAHPSNSKEFHELQVDHAECAWLTISLADQMHLRHHSQDSVCLDRGQLYPAKFQNQQTCAPSAVRHMYSRSQLAPES